MTAPAAERAHDLPPRWDGHPVTWEPWSTEIPTTLRLHVDDFGACDRCGSLELRQVAKGTITPAGAPTAMYPHQLWLYASRCPDCGHDTVVDPDGEVWDLEPSDYTDAGSDRPERPGEQLDQPPAPAASPPVPARPKGRRLPADTATCDRCGATIVWAVTVAGPNGRGGKKQPLDPHEDPAGRVAVLSPRRGRLLARALMADEKHDPPHEYLAMPHAATCTPGERWT